MKAHYRTVNQTALERRAHEIAQEELEKMRDEIYEKIEADCCYQAIAVTMWILHRDFGFGEERLKRLKNGIEDEYALMLEKPMGREYMPKDIMEWLKKRYGVDFDESQYDE